MAKKTYKEVLDKTNEWVDEWAESIKKSFEEKRRVDNMLSPSRPTLERIEDQARYIYRAALFLEHASEMAHQKVIPVEVAQKLMDAKVGQMLADLDYLKKFLMTDDNEKK